MKPAAHIVPTGDHRGHHQFGVWLYDLDRPRLPNADNPASRYAVIGFHGSFRSRAEAEDAVIRAASGVYVEAH